MKAVGWAEAAVVVAVLVGTTPRDAGANTCSTSCDAKKCVITCDDDPQYVIFGEITKGGSPQGVGVCYFNRAGTTFVGWTADSSQVTSYLVYLAGDGDLVRIGDPGGEVCGQDGGQIVEVTGSLPSPNNYYYFYGGNGDDYIYLSSRDYSGAPDYTECIDNPGFGIGDGGADHIYGSYYGETLWGEAGADELFGYGGGDILYGGAGDDDLDGGDADDTLYGNADCDDLVGGGGSNVCWCEDSSPPGGYAVSGCTTSYYCGSC